MNPATVETSEPDREVRFAVVIYGGVSLAIYINGIVQELLRMVRATALPPDQLRYSETVYHKLGCMVGVAATGDRQAADRATTIYDEPAPWPRTKFVADIFSGASAGGINAIFCAKALATGQSLDELAKLWIDVADIDKLLNDKGSVEPPLKLQRPPASVLNAKWMYLQLLNALTAMDQTADSDARPLVGDLDVFLTATDLDGLPVRLALPHQNVEERRHRNVFHFVRRESGERDDFAQPRDFAHSNNPFFAFAARCTSAFPFAFEPMALCDVFSILRHVEPYSGHDYSCEDTTAWEKFYLDYLRDEEASGTPFRLRAFGDGGYLDNKPFSYAIDTISARSADLPVDRKLIYIEPSPETVFERRREGPDDRPDFVENSFDALVALPRYETIREDLNRLLEWNRNVSRLKRVIAAMDPDVETAEPGRRQTAAYRAYQRLRHSATVDSMTLRLAAALNMDPAGARATAIRALIDGWLPPNSPPSDLRRFLDAYDFDYFARAAQYLRARIPAAKSAAGDRKELAELKRAIRQCREDRLTNVNLVLDAQTAQALDSIVAAAAPASASNGKEAAMRLRAKELLDHGWRKLLDDTDKLLRTHFAAIFDPQRLLALLGRYGGFERFEIHDSIVFPIVFGTQIGEFGEVDVVRISPKDVTPLAGLTDTKEKGRICGDALGAFGAFLNRDWRKHDILRGRLDGAEGLITAVLPGDDDRTRALRKSLVMEAQKEIARDWEKHYAEL